MPYSTPSAASAPELDQLLVSHPPVAIGVSGGKDSQAAAIATMQHLDALGHRGPRVLIHADLGVVEWDDSIRVCQKMAQHFGIELIIVRRAAGDLMQRWEARWRSPLIGTERGGFGNSKILAPDLRDTISAYLVSRWLIEKATARLRREGRIAGSFSIHISPENGGTLAKTVRCAESQDTAVFLRINRALWRGAWRNIRGARIVAVGVHLGNMNFIQRRNGDLLRDITPGELTPGERAAQAVDFINNRFGAGSITYGPNIPHPGFFERG